jgi:hypothetical protein
VNSPAVIFVPFTSARAGPFFPASLDWELQPNRAAVQTVMVIVLSNWL